MAADVTNPMSNWGSAGLQFINADVTLSLGREPVGVDVGIATLPVQRRWRGDRLGHGVRPRRPDRQIVVVSSIASDAFKH